MNYADLKMHAQWYTRSFRGAVDIRRHLSTAKSTDAILEIIRAYKPVPSP